MTDNPNYISTSLYYYTYLRKNKQNNSILMRFYCIEKKDLSQTCKKHNKKTLQNHGKRNGSAESSVHLYNYFLKKSGILIDCSFTLLDGVLG